MSDDAVIELRWTWQQLADVVLRAGEQASARPQDAVTAAGWDQAFDHVAQLLGSLGRQTPADV